MYNTIFLCPKFEEGRLESSICHLL